ncbi:MAG: hypothetical protein E6Q97_37105 [Desulfurellales bacterium]|nr:MAG: hypothetical protein E6Q97_37105 [Desulfurellales bacterium]
MPTQSAQVTVGDGLVRINATVTKTVSGNVSIEETIANAETNKLVACSFPSSGLKLMSMSSDKDITVKTNSSGSPQETFALKANEPVLFIEGQTALLAGAVTALYITNASGSSATFKLIAGYDVTP